MRTLFQLQTMYIITPHIRISDRNDPIMSYTPIKVTEKVLSKLLTSGHSYTDIGA